MKISLQPSYKSHHVEHVTVTFKTTVPENALVRALGKLDDGDIEFIEIPNHLATKEIISNYFLPEFYKIEY